MLRRGIAEKLKGLAEGMRIKRLWNQLCDWLLVNSFKAFVTGPLLGIGVWGGLGQALDSLGVMWLAFSILGFWGLLLFAREDALKRRQGPEREERAKLEVLATEAQERADAEAKRVEEYMRTLNAATARATAPFREEAIVIYEIGLENNNDVVRQVHDTIASKEATVLWRTFYEEATGNNVRHTSFGPLQLAHEGHPIKTDFLPIEESGSRLRGMIIFAQEIADVSEKWTLSYRWPGMWKDLRERGQDTSYYEVEDENLKRIEVRFKFPAGMARPGWMAPTPHEGEKRVEDNSDGSVSLIWWLENPQPKLYRFGLKVDGA